MNNTPWYTIDNVMILDSPALVVYKDRVLNNIRRCKMKVKDISLLRPHVKTNKMADVCRLMMDEGITKFKCATIAETEMLGNIAAPDVLLAYQPVGPKIHRLLELQRQFPETIFSCLVDNAVTAGEISSAFSKHNQSINVFIDLNVGMNRTGILPADAPALVSAIQHFPGLRITGLHAYDGHIADRDAEIRRRRSDKLFEQVNELFISLQKVLPIPITIVAGGSPTFPYHAERINVECSPGTFVFWDWSYQTLMPEEPFEIAAVVMTRIISIIDENTICVDLGHKSIAAENPPPRVLFLNAPDSEPVSHSEEHLVLRVNNAKTYTIGDVLYGVPRHICPTVALYERAVVVEHHQAAGEWPVTARNKRLRW